MQWSGDIRRSICMTISQITHMADCLGTGVDHAPTHNPTKGSNPQAVEFYSPLITLLRLQT